MRILTFGVNYKTAAVDLRERIAINVDDHSEALVRAKHELGLEGVAMMSTCNRTEMYLTLRTDDTPERVWERVTAWFAERQKVNVAELVESSYGHWDQAAVEHVMRVASGLDSMVLGEPQILGQLKSTYTVSKDNRCLCSYLERFFQTAFSTAKEVRTETQIGSNPVSVAFAAVNLAKRIFTNIAENEVLIVGAGETAELLATHFSALAVEKMVVANRTVSRAQALAERFSGDAISLSDLSDALSTADIVVSSTASQLPIIGKGMVEAAIRRRKHRPILMLDLAVPRDIEPEVSELPDVFLYSVDDLQSVIEDNRKERERAAEQAEEIISARSAAFTQQIKELDALATLKSFRKKIETIRTGELTAALKRLERGEDPQDVLARMSRSMINKLMHEPSIQIKRAGAEGRVEQLQLVHELFGLELDVAASSSDSTVLKNTSELQVLSNQPTQSNEHGSNDDSYLAKE